MNKKNLLILVALAIIVCGIGLVAYNRQQASWMASGDAIGQKVLGEFPINEVSRVLIKDNRGEVTLLKIDDVWRVKERDDYPANFLLVGEAIRKLWELKVVQEVKAGISQLPRLHLVEPAPQAKDTGTLVDLQDKNGKRIQAILLGKKSYLQPPESPEDEGAPNGRFVKALREQAPVALVLETFEVFQTAPESWIDKDFIHVGKIKSISFMGQKPNTAWEITRDAESAEWKLNDSKPGEQLDPAKLMSFANLLSVAPISDVLNPNNKGVKMDHSRIVNIQTFDGFNYTLKVGQENGDNCPIEITVNADLKKERVPGQNEKPEDKERLDKEFQENLKRLEEKLEKEKKFEGHVYLVSKFMLEPVLKERSQLFIEKAPANTPSATPPLPKSTKRTPKRRG